MSVVKLTQYLQTPAQVYSKGIQMSLVVNGRTIHPIIFCKDFISDIFWLNHQRKAGRKIGGITIYKFRYFRKLDLLSMPSYQLYVQDYGQSGRGEALQNFLNEAEIRANFPYSTVQPLSETEYLVTFDKAWAEYPYLLSLFLLFVRVGTSYDNSDFFDYLDEFSKKVITAYANSSDPAMIRAVKPIINGLFKNQELYEDSWLTYDDVMYHHNYKGVVNFTSALQNKK